MRKIAMVLMFGVLASISNGCVATRKFTRNEVKTSSDALNARVDKTDGEVNEVRDGVSRVDGRVTTVDGRVTQLDKKVDGEVAAVRGDVSNVDQKAGRALTTADQAVGNIANLDEKFQNRNRFTVAAEKTVLFRFDSAKLDSKYEMDLEEVAAMLRDNPDALVVLEGRTDSRGESEYNVKLGERRVESVRRYLAVDKGIPVFKIHNISFGAAKPIADNASKEGREKNRAVVLTVLVPNTTAGAITQNP